MRATYNDERLLQQATAVFLHHDWTVATQFNGMVHIEKKRAPSSLGAALLIVLFRFDRNVHSPSGNCELQNGKGFSTSLAERHGTGNQSKNERKYHVTTTN